MKRLAGLLCLALLAVPLGPLPAPHADPAQPKVDWRPCHRRAGNFDCATVMVPLDHDRPDAKRIPLALVRLRASDPASRIGSLFLNPGGPGGSGVDLVLEAGSRLFGDQVRARFDLVGFDPRGIMRSAPLLCFRSLEASFRVLSRFAFPLGRDQEALVARRDRDLNTACQRRGGPIVDHMATADVARDLDILRSAVGDDRLSFVGYSYGSFLGVTYASLFPDRVRAVVVDGVLDPIAWTTGRGRDALRIPFSTRLHSDAGAQATLEQFFRLCDKAGRRRCAFAGDAGARFAALAKRLREGPLRIVDPRTGDSFRLTYSAFIANALSAMYSSSSWPFLARFLARVEAGAPPPALREALRTVHRRTGLTAPRPRRPYPNFVEGIRGVMCSDSVNPRRQHFWSQAGAAADRRFGYFGRIWTWISSACAVWEGFDADRYLGPFDRDTPNAVMVVGNRFDPATRYQGAVLVDELLPDSSLLTVRGWGHTSLFLSRCADRTVSRYLLNPPDSGDTTCAQDVAPFERRPAGGRALDARRRTRAEVMSEIATVPTP